MGSAALKDDAGIPALLLRSPDEPGQKTAADAARERTAGRVISISPPPRGRRFNDDAELRREADRLWREWLPTMTDRTRPQLRSILQRLREEQEATMKKTTAKADGLRKLREAAAAKAEKDKKATTSPQPSAAPAVEAKAGDAPAAETEKESPVKRETSKTTKASSRGAVKAKTTSAKSNGKSKVELIAGMLKRQGGCTSADVLKATGWPAVSMPQQAKAAGLKLRKEKDGAVTRYYAA